MCVCVCVGSPWGAHFVFIVELIGERVVSFVELIRESCIVHFACIAILGPARKSPSAESASKQPCLHLSTAPFGPECFLGFARTIHPVD